MTFIKVVRGIGVKVGRYQLFKSQGAFYLDRKPFDEKSWRIIVGRHPIWLPFSQRTGKKAGPRIWTIGGLSLAWYAPGVTD